MTLTGRHYDSLLIPPLELPRREAGAFGDLAGREALIHANTKTGTAKVKLQGTKSGNLFETLFRENVAPIVSPVFEKSSVQWVWKFDFCAGSGEDNLLFWFYESGNQWR